MLTWVGGAERLHLQKARTVVEREVARLLYERSSDPAAVPFRQYSHRSDFRGLLRSRIEREESDLAALFRCDEGWRRSCGLHELEQSSLELKPIRQRSQDGFRYGSVGVSVRTQFDGQL